MRIAIYARVSTTEQTTENQLNLLKQTADSKGWTIVHTFMDEGISGAKGREKRPAFNALCEAVEREEIDLVVCWSFDRLSRSLKDLLTFVELIERYEVGLYVHNAGGSSIDTTSPLGRFMFQMFGAVAEFERNLIGERVRLGMARAKQTGTKSGRPIGKPRLIDTTLSARVVELRQNGLSLREIGKECAISHKTVDNILKQAT